MTGSYVPLFLARRFRWRTEGSRRNSPSVGIAVTGVALSLIVMLVSVAVVLGFKKEVKGTLLALDDAITITAHSADGSQVPINSTEVLSLLTLPDGVEVVNHVETAAILKTDDDFVAVNLSGSDSYVDPAQVNSVALSAHTASRLGLDRGEKIPAYFFIDNRIRVRNLTVDSVYASGVDEHDAIAGYCSPELPRRLLKLAPDEASAIGIRGISQEQIEPLADEIHSTLLMAYYSGQTATAYGITTILQTDSSYFTWLDLLDTNVVVILSLMAAVAAFTLISSLFIIILERVKTIGLLKSLGASNRMIRRTFMLMAERLVLLGLVIGNIVGLGLIVVESQTHFITLDSASYYVDHVPVSISFWTVMSLNIATVIVSWMVLMIPTAIINRISPASTMRYE